MSVRHFSVSLLVFVALCVLPLLLPSSALAATGTKWGDACVGGTPSAGQAVSDVATIQGLECLIANVLTVFIALIGLAAFVMVVIAAFRYLLSGGNTKGTEQSRNTVTYAVIGIVVALSAFIILNLLTAFTGVDLTKFSIPRDTSTWDGSTP